MYKHIYIYIYKPSLQVHFLPDLFHTRTNTVGDLLKRIKLGGAVLSKKLGLFTRDLQRIKAQDYYDVMAQK